MQERKTQAYVKGRALFWQRRVNTRTVQLRGVVGGGLRKSRQSKGRPPSETSPGPSNLEKHSRLKMKLNINREAKNVVGEMVSLGGPDYKEQSMRS